MMETFKYMKIGKEPEPTEVYAEIILASGDIEITVRMELCRRILDGNGMPEDLAASVAIPILKGKGNIINCGMYRGVKLLEHAMKIVGKVLDKNYKML